MKKQWRIVFFLILSMLVVKGTWAQSVYKKMNVCQALRIGNQVLNVELDAGVESDGMHGAILTDARCPGRGLILGVFPDNPDPSVTEFQKTLWSDGSPGTTGRKVSGKFFGRLRRDAKTRKVSIVVQRVENLLNVRTSPKLSDLH